jgi:hypothetical protein
MPFQKSRHDLDDISPIGLIQVLVCTEPQPTGTNQTLGETMPLASIKKIHWNAHAPKRSHCPGKYR